MTEKLKTHIELNHHQQATITLVLAILFALLAGCGVNRNPVSSPIDMPEKFSFPGGQQELPARWWTSFNDPNLNAAISEALGENFTIRSAWDRLTQAEQLAAQAGAKLLPSADYQANVRRTRQENQGPLTPRGTTYSTEYSLGLVASYEVDLWGKIRSRHQAAVLDTETARENLQSAAVTITANVAKTWYRLAEAKQQERIINRQIRTNQKVLDLVKTRFNKGQVGASDVFRQQQLLESTRTQLNQVHENIVLLQHQLSVLLGKPPKQRWSSEQMKLTELSELPRLKVPAELIHRRPDIASAYKQVQAADMRAAAAVADQYPSVSISSTVNTSADRPGELFDDWLANLAGNITGPLFDAGRRKAEAGRTRAVLSQAINDYARQLLQALQEVEDALNQEYYQRCNVRDIQTQLSLARKVYDRTRQNYIKGQADYLRVLDAQESFQRLERNELTARRLLVERRIDLYRSIAGGYRLERPEMARVQPGS